MKRWHYEQIAPAANGCVSGTLAEWPYLAEALTEQGIRLPLNTWSMTLQAICRLILVQRKTIEANAERSEARELQSQLLDRDIYASRHDVAQCYADYCEEFAAAGWLTLDDWELGDHIGPVDYIAARIGK